MFFNRRRAHHALRFDPEAKKFTSFWSPIYKNADGVGMTYGLAADGDGNAWWAQMNIDMVAKCDVQTGESSEVKLSPAPGQMDLVTADERKMYALSGSTWNSAMPWAEGSRRLGADKNGNFVWVCDWWGGNLAKIDTHTLRATMIPKFDPKASPWTGYPFPTFGAETRYVSLLERDGSLQVILPYSRTRRVARMTFRTKQDLQAMKNQAQTQEQTRIE